MERIVLLLILFGSFLNAKEPDYIFWARLTTKNLILINQEFHLSRAMSIDKKAKYTYSCELTAKNTNDVYESLKEQKEDLIDCISNAYAYEYTNINNFEANIKSHLRILPIYFKAELADGKILIFRKEKV